MISSKTYALVHRRVVIAKVSGSIVMRQIPVGVDMIECALLASHRLLNHLLAHVVALLDGQVQGRLVVAVLHVEIGAGTQQQLHAFASVVHGTEMERRVLSARVEQAGRIRLPVEALRGHVLYEKVDDMQGRAHFSQHSKMQCRLAVLGRWQGRRKVSAFGPHLQQLTEIGIDDGLLEIQSQVALVGACSHDVTLGDILGANKVVALLHGAVGTDLELAQRRLEDLVQLIVAHCACNQQMGRLEIVQRETLDARVMHAQVAMHSRALDAHEDPKVDADPRDVIARATIAALVIAW